MDKHANDHALMSAEYKDEAGHYHGNTTTIMGRTINQPIYTVVFFALGLLTVIEVALSQLPRGFLTVPLMLGLSAVKASLVVWFYMHLNKDSRIFLLALLAPLAFVILATVFLMIVPVGY